MALILCMDGPAAGRVETWERARLGYDVCIPTPERPFPGLTYRITEQDESGTFRAYLCE
jgi:hypothetical protein